MTVYFTQKGSIVMTDRIQLILKTLNLSPTRLADEIDVQRSSVSHILSGRNKPSLDFIMKLLSTYPEINSDWLLFGKGQMFIVGNKSNPEMKDGKQATEKGKIDKTAKDVKRKDIFSKDEKIIDTGLTEKIVVFYSDGTFREYVPE